ncbi:hypothetical protein B9Z55_027708 [Caenorhabditis nigoni]|uniref:Uncharacterized protein n=1 Tax=Caenorhabditis nigoni TaxID=1611254 RepID=A0A2G5SEW2_9PELO|nr:hypothetical protein B9Z55_027708 [Caenorhabditis nigoni]
MNIMFATNVFVVYSPQKSSELIKFNKLETLTLHGPAYEEPVINNGQSEKEQLVEQVKEDNEQLEKAQEAIVGIAVQVSIL